jgi:hypothetical protein
MSMRGGSSSLGMEQAARKDEVMIRVIPALVIAFASLWLALPAAAQSEIDPDHFDDQGMIAGHPRPTRAKKSERVRLQHKRVQRDRAPGLKGTKNPNDRDADIVECSGRSTPPAHWHKSGRAGAC